MKAIEQILQIASRLDHLGSCAEWIARETVHSDNTLSQTGTLISVITEDIRERIECILSELEQSSDWNNQH